MKNSIYISTLCAILLSNSLFSQTATLVRDLTTGVNGTNPKSIVTYKNKIYFVARNPTAGNVQQIYGSDLSFGGTGLEARFSSNQIIGNLTVTDSVLPNGNTLPRYNLFFVSKRIGPEAEVFEIKEFDGTTEGVLRNLNVGLYDVESSPIMDVQLTKTTQEESNQEQTHINPITKHSDGTVYYSNIGLDNGSDSLRWSQDIEYDSLAGPTNVFFNIRTWFFPRRKRAMVEEDDEIRTRDDNAQGTMTPSSVLPDSIVGIASGYINDFGAFGNRESRFLFFSKLTGKRRLKSILYSFNGLNASIPSEAYGIQESDSLSIDVTQRGVYYGDRAYFIAQNNGLYRCDFKDMKPVSIRNDIFDATTVANLSVINGRLFFTASTRSTTPAIPAPFGGVFEIIDNSIYRRDSFPATGRRFEQFVPVKNLCIGISKTGTTYQFNRYDGRFSPNLGTATNVDINAGIALINDNKLVFSADNGTTGQELYQLGFTKPRCTGKPFFTCPSNISVTTSTTSAAVTLPNVTISDNCNPTGRTDSTLFLSSHQSGNYNLGTTTVFYSATNAFGTFSCTFTVKVTSTTAACATDVLPPVIQNCPAATTVLSYNDGNCLSKFSVNLDVINNLTATDNCTLFPTLTTTFSPLLQNDCLTAGVNYTVTVRAQDARGNQATPCVFPVKFTNLACAIQPIFRNCPDDIIVTIPNGQTRGQVDTSNFWNTPRLNDQCDPNARITLSHPKNTFFPLGRTRVTYASSNSQGQSAKCSFYVSVMTPTCATNRTIPSVSNCPTTAITVFTKTDSAAASWRSPTFSDGSCGVILVDSSHKSGSKFPIGTTIVEYIGTNSRGVTNRCTFNIAVNRCVTTTQTITRSSCNPADTGRTSRTLTAFTGCDSVVTTITTLKTIPPTPRNETICQGQVITIGTQTFNRTGNFSVTLRNTEGCDSVVNLALIVNLKDTIRSVTTTCTVGNVGSDTLRFRNRFGCDSLRISSRVFSTTDTVKPILSPCPANFNSIVTDTVRNCAVVTWTPPTATDNCSPTVTISSNFPSGSCFLIGTTEVVYNARDQQGNIATCSFKITVVGACAMDTTRPTFVNCPRDTVLRTNQTCAIYSWPTLIVQDNCGGVIRIGSSHRSGECFNLGTTTVTLSATDVNNNFSVCTFKVKVESSNKIADIDTTFSKIRLEPNPTEGDLALIFNSLSSRILTFEFYDAIGRRIERVTKNSSIGENRIEFDVRPYAAGMYWVKPIVKDKPLPALRFIKL